MAQIGRSIGILVLGDISNNSGPGWWLDSEGERVNPTGDGAADGRG